MNNKGIFDQFKLQYKDLVNTLDDELQNALENNDSFEGVWNAIFNYDGTAKEELQAAMDDLFNSFALTYTSEEHKKIMETVIAYQTRLIDEQIDNLTKQKEALSAVNEEHKKELALMKAQEALENAKKEKKMVYRAGVGFVYEADEEAIAEAQENLDNLQVEKQEEILQREIEALELQKEILEYLPNIETIEAQQEIYNAWATKIEETGGIIDGVPGVISAITDDFSSTMRIAVDELRKMSQDNIEEQNDTNSADVATAYEEYQRAIGELANYEEGTFAYNKQLEKANSKFDALNSAVKTAQSNGVSYDSQAAIDDILSNGKQKASDVIVSTNGKQTSDKQVQDMKFSTAAGNDITEGDRDKYFGKDKYTHLKFPYSQDANGNYYIDTETPSEWGFIDKKGFHPEWMSLSDYNKDSTYMKNSVTSFTAANLASLPLYTLIANDYGQNRYAFVGSGDAGRQLYWLSRADGSQTAGRMATGTYDLQGNGWAGLINEFGTEGIVTPQGTFTALPSHTGIVPADITKNVWELGEVAPQLIARLGSLKNPGSVSGQKGDTYNDTTHIDAVNVYPTKDYDMDKLLAEAKAKARITKHNN